MRRKINGHIEPRAPKIETKFLHNEQEAMGNRENPKGTEHSGKI